MRPMRAFSARPPARLLDNNRYVPNVCNAVWSVLETMAANEQQPGPKRLKLDEESGGC